MEKADLTQQLISLKQDVSRLGTHLAEASGCLRDAGVLPSQALIEAIITARADLDRLRSRLLSEAQSLALQPAPEQDDLSSLGKLESLLHTITHAREARGEAEMLRQCALSTLARVMTLQHHEGDPFAPLLELQNSARDLHQAVSNASWSELHPDTQVLVNGRHPFSTLIMLIERQEQLEDDEWVSLQEIIAQSFGKAMAVAAARGKLFFSEFLAAADEHAPPASRSPVNEHEQTVRREDEDIPTIASTDNMQGAAVIAQGSEADPEADAALGESELDASPAMLDDIAVEIPLHADLHHVSAAPQQAPQTAESDGQYDAHTMKQADLDRFLKEQLDSVRKDVITRQKQGFIKNIGRKFM